MTLKAAVTLTAAMKMEVTLKTRRIFSHLVLLVALQCTMLVPFAKGDTNLRIRLWSQHPVQQITLGPSRQATLQRCNHCRRQAFQHPLTFTANRNYVVISGVGIAYASKQLISVQVNGQYRISSLVPNQVSQPAQPTLELPLPLLITAKYGRLQLTLTLPREDYVAAVLAGESSNFTSDQALRSMAVAARTYATAFHGRHAGEGFDFCDTTHCQDFHWSAISPRLRAAAEATQGEILWFKGSPALTYYHRHCGGQLASAADLWPDADAMAAKISNPQLPYLTARPDRYCLRHDSGVWEAKLDHDAITAALATEGVHLSPTWRNVIIAKHNSSGRAQILRFADGTTELSRVPAATLRIAVGRTLGWNLIRSDLFEIHQNGNLVILTGHGYGHGVGLCQTGAEQMGREGKDYHEILTFYYPGTTLGITSKGIFWQSFHNDRVDVLATEDPGSAFFHDLTRALGEAESLTGWRLTKSPEMRPLIKLYPTLDTFRDATGEPGWVKASTRGRTIRLQPLRTLQKETHQNGQQPWPHLGGLDSTLLHEFLHQLVEAHAKANTPLWFREGLVLWLEEPTIQSGIPNLHRKRSSPTTDTNLDAAITHPASADSMGLAYAESKVRVTDLIQNNGKLVVLNWLQQGLPR